MLVILGTSRRAQCMLILLDSGDACVCMCARFQDGRITFAELADGLRRKNKTFKQEDTKLAMYICHST
jgi:hypothetical protein